MEIADPCAVLEANDFDNAPIEPRLDLFRVHDHLIDEVAEVEDEAELLGAGAAHILVDHPAPGVGVAFVDGLAAYEGEADGACVVVGRCGDGAADAAAIPLRIDKAEPVDPRWPEPADQHPAGPVGRRGDPRRGAGHDPAEGLVLGQLDHQHHALAVLERPAGPQDDAVRRRIARGDAFRIEIAPLAPGRAGRPRRPGPGERRPHRRSRLKKVAPVKGYYQIPPPGWPSRRPGLESNGFSTRGLRPPAHFTLIAGCLYRGCRFRPAMAINDGVQ